MPSEVAWAVLPDFRLQVRTVGALSWVMGALATLKCLKQH